jgi:two-component system, LuxR family, response regulator FixJ
MMAGTVFIVDDDASVLDSLRVLLSANDYSVETYSSPLEFLGAYRAQAGCLLLDMRMPDMDGLQLQQELAVRGWRIPIIFISANPEVRLAVKALKAGAFEYLEKPLDSRTLLEHIDNALAGDQDFRAGIAQRDAARAAETALTAREKEVMILLGCGLSSKEIASKLMLSHRTVEGHRSRIKEKTGAKSLSEMIALAKLIQRG